MCLGRRWRCSRSVAAPPVQHRVSTTDQLGYGLARLEGGQPDADPDVACDFERQLDGGEARIRALEVHASHAGHEFVPP